MQAVVTLFEGVALAPAEAARLARLVGSWPEMLAHLTLRRDGFGRYPELSALLLEAAAAYRGGLASPRPPGADAGRLAAAATGLQAALTGLMEAERARLAAADAVSAALGAQAAERAPDGFDLHLRISPPA